MLDGVTGNPDRFDRFADDQEQALKDKVVALIPLLRSEAAAAEQARNMTDAVYRALDDIGIWWMLLPRRWGGYGLSCSAMSRINSEVAKGDPAAAWVVQILNGTTWIGSLTTDRLQEDLFSNGPTRICSSFAAPGAARPVEGGYIVDGLWPYNSGCRQAQWGQYLVKIEHADGRVSPGNFAYVEMRDVEIVDTWYTAGMQGTSSDSARITNLFVPEHRMVLAEKPFGYDTATRRHAGEPSDYWPVISTIRSAGLGLQLGAAEAAIELALEIATSKSVPNTTYALQSQSPVIQRNLGQAKVKIHTARLIVDDVSGTLDRFALKHEQPDLKARALNKAQCSLTVEILTEVMNTIMNCAGSSAFLQNNALQRYWRDISVAARHAIYNPDVGYEIFGRSLLNVEPNIAPPGLI